MHLPDHIQQEQIQTFSKGVGGGGGGGGNR